MKSKQIILTIILIGLSRFLACADGLTNNPNLRSVRHGSYTYTWMVTNHVLTYVNPNEFWPGTWKEDANGWRVQLCIYPEANYWYPKEGFGHPISTNLMLSVEWGSAVKNSDGDYYYRSPNGKFAKFELRDVKGNVISPNPNAGTNLLEWLIYSDSMRAGRKLIYETNLPAWVSPTNGSLVSIFPKTISLNVYPQVKYYVLDKIDYKIMGEIGANTNFPPFPVGLLKLDEIYSVTNEDDYTLTVQPVLYKKRNETNLLDRVDLPSVTTKVHLVPNVK